MEASVLIVSKNRHEELQKTLNLLNEYLDNELHEILVFLDGCTDESERLIKVFPEVNWEISKINQGASKARNILYKKAKGTILFGFDDDAHPLQKDFITITQELFKNHQGVGLIGFNEIKGNLSEKELELELDKVKNNENYLTNDFLGCGFAIRKEAYDKTRGFPSWIDIYGEEICLSWEIMDLGFDILFAHSIYVNHRVDILSRKKRGANYFRFQKQLKNMTYFYLVYYPFPLLGIRIFRLYYKNFTKYAFKDFTFFRAFIAAFGEVISNFLKVLKFRKPVSVSNVKKFSSLSSPRY